MCRAMLAGASLRACSQATKSERSAIVSCWMRALSQPFLEPTNVTAVGDNRVFCQPALSGQVGNKRFGPTPRRPGWDCFSCVQQFSAVRNHTGWFGSAEAVSASEFPDIVYPATDAWLTPEDCAGQQGAKFGR